MRNPKILFLFPLLIAFGVIAGTIADTSPIRDTLLYKAGNDYAKEWQQVDTLVQQGLPKDALKLVEQLRGKAMANNNYAQIIKTLLYLEKLKYENYDEDGNTDGSALAIAETENEITEAPYPAKPILQSMLADMYWSYYQQNRYKILQRTVVKDFKQTDIATWDAARFAEKTANLYLASLQFTDSLQRTKLEVFDQILFTYPGSKNYRPTLYDLLAWKGITFFSNSESGVTKAADHFSIDNTGYLGTAKDFTALKLPDTDTISFQLKAMKLFQQYTAYQLQHGSTTSLVDLEAKRLEFVHNNLLLEGKDSLYLLSLQQLEQRYINDSISAMVGLQIAQQLNNRAGKSNTNNTDNYKWGKKQAVEKCREVIARFPNSSWAQACIVLMESIQTKSLTVETEKVNVPNKPFKALVTYANTDTIYLRVVKANATDATPWDIYVTNGMLKILLQQTSVAGWSQALQGNDDYSNHSAEVKIPELKLGAYYLLVANNPKFNFDSGIVNYCRVNISNIGFISRPISSGTAYLLHDRTTGEPLKNATMQVYANKYDNTSRRDIPIKTGDYKSDGEGRIVSAVKEKYGQYVQTIITYKDDQLDTRDYSYQYNYRQTEGVKEKKWEDKVFLFLDRAIYRPGQTVYFKGLVIETDGEKNRIKKHSQQTVELEDANGNSVSELELTTNDYGTFSGSFILPNSGLNGEFTISADDGEIGFQVEDYKRPHFEVTFDPIKGSFKLGEKVTVTGKAVNYSGTSVDHSKVTYRVTRHTNYPYWDFDYWWKPRPYSAALEVAHDTVSTDANGAFTINFTTVADTKVSEKDLPEYNYNVSVDVMDQANETHSATTSVNVGVIALRADMELRENYQTTDTVAVGIKTENLNGQFEAAKGTIQIYRLVDPGLLQRDRKWTAPDQFTMTEAEYHKLFPNDTYKDETQYQAWAKGDKVVDLNFDSEKGPRFHLTNLSTWKQGRYKAELLTHDHFGKEVKVVKYFTVIDYNKKEMPYTTLSYFATIKNYVEPGDKAIATIGTSAKDVRVLYEVVFKGQVIHKEWLRLSNEKKTVQLPIEERYQGMLQMNFTYVTHERIFTNSQLVMVPYSTKQLKMEFATFRDKLQPGNQEEWKIKITGNKGEKVAAEMLASMYDASLDVFVTDPWKLDLYNYNPSNNNLGSWAAGVPYELRNATNTTNQWNYRHSGDYFKQGYDQLKTYYNPFLIGRRNYKKADVINYADGDDLTIGADVRDFNGFTGNALYSDRIVSVPGAKFNKEMASETVSMDVVSALPSIGITNGWGYADAKNGGFEIKEKEKKPMMAPRTNFAETAFFYPQLQTDSTGNIVFSFKVPDALTRWKFRALAHTQDLKYGMLMREAVTQKDLMIITNAPRFLREGDDIELTAKVNSLSDKDLSGKATLTLIDPSTNQTVTNQFGNEISDKAFQLPKGQSTSVSWKLHVPQGLGLITYRITAEAGNFTDGEEAPLPVLTNRMLVTESMPINIKGGEEKIFSMDKLVAANKSTTLTQHKLTLELTSNPAWYAIQALPYLMEYPYECSEQLFNRFYANSLATYIAGSNPRVKQVFDSWKATGSDALKSNLEKNNDLKSLLLEEMPWVREANNETERKQRLALLFDLNKMSAEQSVALKKLMDNQAGNGGWSWFKDMPDNRYITQYITTGLGRLQHMGAIDYHHSSDIKKTMTSALLYLDQRIEEDYRQLVKDKVDLTKQQITDIQVQYLYARTFYKDWPLPNTTKTAYDYYLGQAKQYWLQQSKYSQAMTALVLAGNDNTMAAQGILKSLTQTASRSDEKGMYWVDNTSGYFWYQASIETQAMMIEAFSEVGKDQTIVDDLRTWLLKQKQTQDWQTTKATSDACYALLLNGTDWLTTTEVPSIMVGNEKVEPGKNAPAPEAGTGYIRTSWSGKEITSDLGKVTVKKQGKGIAWGSLYWQYFEQLDKITPAKTPLKLDKKLFIQTNSNNGPVLTPINDNTILKPGDLVKVRIELRSDRDMDFVHMKDMRASAFEPVDVLSGYHYQGGLGYYQSTRDAATNFFFDRLNKGTYVFEYALRVSQRGNFSNGVTTIQCMYAPEFTSHSEGVRVKVQ